MEGGQQVAYDDLPESLKKYVRKRGFLDQASMALLVQPGKSLLQTFVTMMGAAGLAMQAQNSCPNRLGHRASVPASDPASDYGSGYASDQASGQASDQASSHASHDARSRESREGSAMSAEAIAAHRASHPLTQKYAASLRDADPTRAEEKEVKIYYPRCKTFEKKDTHPQYDRQSDIYISRQHPCKDCKKEVSGFRPTDGREFVLDRSFRQKLREAGLVKG